VSSRHVSKPIAPPETVEQFRDKDGLVWECYVHHVRSPKMDLDVTINNNMERMQVGFLFWVLPVPYSKSGSPDARIQIDVRPTGTNVTLDPWRILYIPAPGAPDAPAKISRLENGKWKPRTPFDSSTRIVPDRLRRSL